MCRCGSVVTGEHNGLSPLVCWTNLSQFFPLLFFDWTNDTFYVFFFSPAADVLVQITNFLVQVVILAELAPNQCLNSGFLFYLPHLKFRVSLYRASNMRWFLIGCCRCRYGVFDGHLTPCLSVCLSCSSSQIFHTGANVFTAHLGQFDTLKLIKHACQMCSQSTAVTTAGPFSRFVSAPFIRNDEREHCGENDAQILKCKLTLAR